VLGRHPAVGLGDIGARGDAEQRVVRLVHRGVGEECLVGRDQRQAARKSEVDQPALDARLGLEAVAHQLDIEAAGKQPGEMGERGLRRVVLALAEQPADQARRPAVSAMSPLVMP
jgi:hypothetical protein